MRLSFLFLLISGVSIAAPEMVPIQEVAQGQSLVGGNLLNDSLYSNPAAASFTQVYSIEGTYKGDKTFGLSVIDTKTSNIGGAMGYYQTPFGENQTLRGMKLSLGSRVSPVVAVGLAGKILWGPSVNGQDQNLKDLDLGVLTNFGSLQFGGMVRNVFGGLKTLNQDAEWGAGGRIGYEQKLFLSAASFSKMRGFDPYQYSIGTEYVTPYYISLKGGYRYQPRSSDRTGLSKWSAGTSFLAPKIALHYAIEFADRLEGSTEHSFAMSLIF